MTKKIPTRIPKANIITGPKPIISQLDKVWLGDSNGVEGTTSTPIGSGIGSASLVTSSADTAAALASITNKDIQIVIPDTIDMTDIESVTYEQYYDTVSKLVKYKAILKIRNSSTNKANVEGVDARIYNPNA